MFKCCICGKKSDEWGNNPAPVKMEGKCCDYCNSTVVIPARLARIFYGEKPKEGK